MIETIGDSLTNGYGELGTETHPNSCSTTVNGCGYTIDTQSNYKSYAAILARGLNADWSILCNSGWGLYRDNQNGLQNVMPNVWDDAYFNYSNPPKWNFSTKAQAVIINLGTNDLAKGDPGVGYKEALKKLVTALRAKYGPDAWIFPTTGSMIDGTGIKRWRATSPQASPRWPIPRCSTWTWARKTLAAQRAPGVSGTPAWPSTSDSPTSCFRSSR